MGTNTTAVFSPGQARAIVTDLFEPKPWIYWTDFLVSLTIGYVAATVYMSAAALSVPQILGFLVAISALYRVAIFMHEIVHFRRREMTAFKVGWNLLAGIPMLTPSFLYEVHVEHHNTRTYGTNQDAEYLPLGHGPWYRVVAFLAQPFLLPIYFAIRFLLVVPVSFLHPKLRMWVLERMSSNAINLRHRRELRPDDNLKLWALVDAACSLRIWIMMVVSFVMPWAASRIPEVAARFPAVTWGLAWRPLQMYAIAVGILTLNHLRTLVAHRYQSIGETLSHTEQLLDSVDIVGDPVFTEIICPLGLRFHALHHLFPAIPYHNMGRAYRRLAAQLPADSPYHSVVYKTFGQAMKAFATSMWKLSMQTPNGADLWYRSGHDAESAPTKREHTAARAGHPNPAQREHSHRDHPHRNAANQNAAHHNAQPKDATFKNDSHWNDAQRNSIDRSGAAASDVERESRAADQPANSRPTLSTNRSIAKGLRK